MKSLTQWTGSPYAANHGIAKGQTSLLRIMFSQGDLANDDSVVTGTLPHFLKSLPFVSPIAMLY